MEPSAFWDFSLAVYGRPEVAAACLGLQDRHGLDVNLLLLACWLGASGRGALGQPAWQDLCAQVAVWQGQVVGPLREVRRRLKGMLPADASANADPIAALRRAVADCELDAERLEQLMLERAVAMADKAGLEQDDAEVRCGAAIANLCAYLAVAGVDATGERRALSVLLGAAFTEFAPNRLAERLEAGCSS